MLRNRCKRRLREIVRKYELHLSYTAGFDLVLNVKSELVEADFEQLKKSFARVMSKFCHEMDRSPSAEIL